MPSAGKTVRVEFSREHDNYLLKYLATYCPSKDGRSGRKIFQRLVANEHKQWPWSVHHTWQSWRERYVKNSAQFDAMILKYQRKHDIIRSVDKRKRAAEPMPTEMLRPSAKRVKLEEEASSPSRETCEAMQHQNANSSTSISASKSKYTPEPPVTPSRVPNSMCKPEPTDAHRTAPAGSPLRSNASASALKKPTAEPTALQTRHDTLEVLPSSPDRQAPPPTNGNHSPPRHTKCIKVRLRTPSDIFASEPSSPRMDAAAPVVGIQGPSSQTRPAPSMPSTGADGAPVAISVYPRAPPRVVDSLHGQVLVDREGHVPRALPHGEEDGVEGEEEEEKEKEEKAQWPPARGRTAKERHGSEPDVEADAHHPFSQPQPQPPGQGKPHSPSGHVPQTFDELSPDRRTVAARFSGHALQIGAPQVEYERREDKIRNGASPVKRIVTTIPPSDPFSGQIPKHLSKVFKFPAPRASTRSPFRPDPPPKDTRHPQPQARPSSRIKAARHPALARIRRQTIGHGHENRNGHEHERQREVPSVDLVALSHSSMSARSHSHSSADASLPARPSRWSLPASVHAIPWILDERVGPSPVNDDLWEHGRVRTSSLMGTSTPRFMLTPSPVRSTTGTIAPVPHANGIHASPTISLTPHPPDLQLTASHGLASILAHMSTNHGLALSVVEAVYKRVGSLREADEVLKGMREAAEGFGEREIEKRVRERRGAAGCAGKHSVGREEKGKEGQGNVNEKSQLRYVVASEDGEGSEYSPPETSRAAMWKRQSETASYAEERDDEETRAVEEELRDRDEQEVSGEDEAHHDFSRHVNPLAENDKVSGQDEDGSDGAHDASSSRRKNGAWKEDKVTEALLEDTRLAQQMERKLGKGRYRRDIARLFT